MGPFGLASEVRAASRVWWRGRGTSLGKVGVQPSGRKARSRRGQRVPGERDNARNGGGQFGLRFHSGQPFVFPSLAYAKQELQLRRRPSRGPLERWPSPRVPHGNQWLSRATHLRPLSRQTHCRVLHRAKLRAPQCITFLQPSASTPAAFIVGRQRQQSRAQVGLRYKRQSTWIWSLIIVAACELRVALASARPQWHRFAIN